jgi:hypothetical protein
MFGNDVFGILGCGDGEEDLRAQHNLFLNADQTVAT